MITLEINFDTNRNIIAPTFVLSTKSGKLLGSVPTFDNIIVDSLNGVPEVSFSTYKYIDGEKNILWDKIENFKLLWLKKQNKWFEITVDIDETNNIIKNVYGKDLGISELSQIMLHDIEINTEDDIARDDYTSPTVFYNPDDKANSLLNRITEKAPHYEIKYVADSLKNIQRTFTFDNTTIYDAFQSISEEVNCLFKFNAELVNNVLKRYISVYDLENVCNDCGYRGDYNYQCSECGSTNINFGFGKDTGIFVTSDELTDEIKLTTETDSVKNCFYLSAGDDLMTATIRNCNPNGSSYIWYISDTSKTDMSDELKSKISKYNEDYTYYRTTAPIYIQYDKNGSKQNSLVNYNKVVRKYKPYREYPELESNVGTKEQGFKYDETRYHKFIGFTDLMKTYYDTTDFILYLTSEFMPVQGMATAEEQIVNLNKKNLSPVAVTVLENQVAVETAIVELAKFYIDARYKVEIAESISYYVTGTRGSWDGKLKVTSLTDEEDTATTSLIRVYVTTSNDILTKRRIQKILSNNNSKNLDVTGLFDKSEDDFKNMLKEYCLNRLNSFKEAGKACLDLLVEQGMGDNETWANTTPNIYEDLYVPYYNKVEYIEHEISVRENEIDTIKLIQDDVIEQRNIIQSLLNFENYLGNQLWLEFSSYRREDEYSNTNYISDGLDNSQLFKNAEEFLKVATKEIYKSAEMQHSISTTLNNLLGIEKFKPLLKQFDIGNWIRIKVDGKIYRLRLIEYKLDYENPNQITVEFSDVINISNDVSDVKSILSQASSMATSYDSVKRQSSQGNEANNTVSEWSKTGVVTSEYSLVNDAINQTQTWDKHGILLREYDSNTNDYSNTQMKIINSTIAITDDNWRTTKTAIGKFYYVDPETNEIKLAYGINGEVIIGRLLIGETLGLYNEDNTLKFDSEGLSVTNGVNTVNINPNETSVFEIFHQDSPIFSFNDEGNLVITGDINANSLTLAEGVSIDPAKVKNLSKVATTGDYNDLINIPLPVNYRAILKNTLSTFIPQINNGTCTTIYDKTGILNGFEIEKLEVGNNGIIVIWANDVCLVNGTDYTITESDDLTKYIIQSETHIKLENLTIQVWKFSNNITGG